MIAAPLSIESLPEILRTDHDALLSDRVLSFAAALDRVGLERLRKRLSDGYLSTPDLQAFIRSVKAHADDARKARRHSRQPPQDERPTITITTDEDEVNEQASYVLGRVSGLYERMGELVRVVERKRRRPGEPDPYVVKEIKVVHEPLLRQYLTRAARWVEVDEDPIGGAVKMPAHPPDWCVRAVRENGPWKSVPPLYHLSESPVLLQDGRIIQRNGYDVATGIMLESKIAVNVAPHLTQADAQRSADKLLELVSDVRSFESEAHRSAWLAALLTVVGRWAFTGQSPLFMLDANRPGTGKGFLVTLIDSIALGRHCDYTVHTEDEESEKKLITSKVIGGASMVWIDEVEKPFGSGPMQGLLTSGVWSDRLLGGNEAPTHDVYIVWFASGNNVQLKTGDIARRVCFVRLVTDLDNPAERTDLKIDDMPGHVAAHRAELFEAALTMLRAWILMRLPAASLEGWGGKWGGFDAWDQLVRGAVVFAGLVDPIGAKATRAAPAVKEGMVDLVIGLEQAVANAPEHETTAAMIHSALADNDAERKDLRGFGVSVPPVKLHALRKGIASLMPHLKGATPSAQQLGNLLGRSKEQPVAVDGGRRWIRSRRGQDDTLWRVDVVAPVSLQMYEDETDERAALQSM